jgi:hypothetical protein
LSRPGSRERLVDRHRGRCFGDKHGGLSKRARGATARVVPNELYW